MPNAWIATDEHHIWIGDAEYIKQIPYTRVCIEGMSSEMYEALIGFAQMQSTSVGVASILFHILNCKAPSQS